MKVRAFTAACLLLALLLCSCGSRLPDYSTKEPYTALFTEDDDDIERELKNFIIRQIEFCNAEDYAAYVANIDWEKSDREAYVSDNARIAEQLSTKKTIQTLSSAYLIDSKNQGQVGGLIETVITDKASGTVSAHYTYQVVYTLEKTGETWLVLSEEVSQYDYLD